MCDGLSGVESAREKRRALHRGIRHCVISTSWFIFSTSKWRAKASWNRRQLYPVKPMTSI